MMIKQAAVVIVVWPNQHNHDQRYQLPVNPPSKSRSKPFVKKSRAASPESLLSSELNSDLLDVLPGAGLA